MATKESMEKAKRLFELISNSPRDYHQQILCEALDREHDESYKECFLIVSAQIGLGKTLKDACNIIEQQRQLKRGK